MGDENDIKYLNCNSLKNLRMFKDSPKASLDEFNDLTSHKSNQTKPEQLVRVSQPCMWKQYFSIVIVSSWQTETSWILSNSVHGGMEQLL